MIFIKNYWLGFPWSCILFLHAHWQTDNALIMNTSSSRGPLILIRLMHTLIWVFFNLVIFYLVYSAITGKIDIWTWICLGLIAAEGMVLVISKNVCPVTLMARKYSSSDKANFDIYLPEWLAKHNKQIYTTIVVMALLLILVRQL